MQAFVEANSTRTKLREQLGTALGSGRGKVKVLLLLASQPMTLAEIAEALQVDRPYTTVIVNRLESLGLVERATDARDRRRKLVALTRAGEKAATQTRTIVDAPPVELGRLNQVELRQLGALLSRLVAPDGPRASTKLT